MFEQEQMLLLPLWYAVFLLSVTCHEAAHAFAAWRGGDPTAYLGGQVSLNPLPHVSREPVGTILFPLVSYFFMGWMIGWASAPYDPLWEERHPRRAAAMAVAGPLANLALAALAFVVLKLGLSAGIWSAAAAWPPALDKVVVPASEAAAAWDGLGRLCSVTLALNLVLFLFNLLPLPPMDGASVVGGLIPRARETYARLRAIPMGTLLGLVIAWHLFGYLFWPIYTRVLQLLWW